MSGDRDLYSGMIRLHILHHAEQELIFGAGMAEELARHGYTISPGTMFPFFTGWRSAAICVLSRSEWARASAAFMGLRNPGVAPSRRLSSVCENSLGS